MRNPCISGNHKQNKHKVWYKDACHVQEVPAGRTHRGVVLNAKSVENGEVMVDMLIGGGRLGEVQNKCHEDARRVQVVPVGGTNGGVILNAKSVENSEVTVNMLTRVGHFREVKTKFH